MTRGLIIGEIIDDLAILKNQITLRSEIGHFDLNRLAEDFFKEIFNITYNLNLSNLNSERHNEPGLDLGDEIKKLGIQITSTKTSSKVNDTLEKITAEQNRDFDNFYIFIIGKKQKTYSLNEILSVKYNFSEKNIKDITDLCRDIIAVDIDKLLAIRRVFKREFMTVKVELEVPDNEGNYETSVYNFLEKKQFIKANNYNKFIEWYKINVEEIDIYKEEDIKFDLDLLFDKLNSIPRTSRELFLIAYEKSKSQYILFQALRRFINYNSNELMHEIQILEEENLAEIDINEFEDKTDKVYVKISFVEYINNLIDYSKVNQLNYKNILIGLNFSYLDN